MKYPILIFLLGGLALTLKGGPAEPAEPGDTGLAAPGDTGLGFEAAVTVAARAVAQAQTMEIYEGLPRDKAASDRERKAAACRQITDQWFYSAPQDFRFKHILKLQRLITGGVFQPWGGTKFCGGFHADFAIALTSPKSTIYVLFCFGCHEARIIREGSPFAADLKTPDFRVTTDLNAKTFEELRLLLSGYSGLERDDAPSGG